MTFIAYACKGDHAEILTDTISYGPNLRRMGTATKYAVFPHLSSAMVCSGAGVITALAKSYLFMSSEHEINDFDQAVERIPELMEELWDTYSHPAVPLVPTSVHLVGYSPAASEFAAFEFASDDDWRPRRNDGVFLHPSPFAHRLGDREAVRLRTSIEGDPLFVGSPELLDAYLEQWQAKPPAEVPATLVEWGELVYQCRGDRGMHPLPNVRILVGGSLHLLRLEQHSHEGMKVLDFDDAGPAWDLMIARSLHPDAQLGPCPCGNDKRAIDCHLAEMLDRPCPCQSQLQFRSCCAVFEAS